MQPDFLDNVFGFRSATRPPGEEPDELRAVRREDRRQAGGRGRVGVGYDNCSVVGRRTSRAAVPF